MNFFKTATLLSHVDLQENDIIFAGQLFEKQLKNKGEQDAFFSYCKKWKMAPLIDFQIQKYDFSNLLSKEIQLEFHNYHQKIFVENENRNAIAVLLLCEFQKAGIDVAVLKGNLFAQTIYSDVGYKKMNDFDLLIHSEDWEKIQEIYFNLGFIPLGFGWGGEKQKPTQFSHTAIPFISPDFKCIVGTQWGLKSPTAPFIIDMEEAWETSSSFDFQGVSCRQLSPEYNLLHLILHLGIYKCGIRDCMDIYNLYTKSQPNEDYFISLLEKSKATKKAKFALEMCQLCSDRIPQKLTQRLSFKQTNFIARRTKNRLTLHKETGDFQFSYNDYFQDIEKNVLFLNAVTTFHHRIYFYGKILRLILFPDRIHCLKFIDKSHQPTVFNRIKGRILGSYFAFSLITQEIGRKFTVLLFIKLFLDVFTSVIYYAFPRQSYFDYLKSKAVNPEKIMKIVNDVQ